MRVCLFTLVFMLSASAYAEYLTPAVDFFMHGRSYDTFLRDHYQFEEPKPFRIEYKYLTWLDSGIEAEEYRDYLLLEGTLPIYKGNTLSVDIPFQYSRIPIWAEMGNDKLGKEASTALPSLMTRWSINDRFKSIIGMEYNIKGDADNIGKSDGRMICFLKGFLSYDMSRKLNLVAGVRLNKYYYDTDEERYALELSDRLYSVPSAMLNWHPSDNFILLLGIPYSGIHLSLGRMLKAEARTSINKETELAFRLRPIERTQFALRFFNTPYVEIPIKDFHFSDSDVKAKRLSYTDRSFCFEAGRELNPATIVSLGFQYGLGSDVDLADRNQINIGRLDGKPYFTISATFTVDLEALFQIQ